MQYIHLGQPGHSLCVQHRGEPAGLYPSYVVLSCMITPCVSMSRSYCRPLTAKACLYITVGPPTVYCFEGLRLSVVEPAESTCTDDGYGVSVPCCTAVSHLIVDDVYKLERRQPCPPQSDKLPVPSDLEIAAVQCKMVCERYRRGGVFPCAVGISD